MRLHCNVLYRTERRNLPLYRREGRRVAHGCPGIYGRVKKSHAGLPATKHQIEPFKVIVFKYFHLRNKNSFVIHIHNQNMSVVDKINTIWNPVQFGYNYMCAYYIVGRCQILSFYVLQI